MGACPSRVVRLSPIEYVPTERFDQRTPSLRNHCCAKALQLGSGSGSGVRRTCTAPPSAPPSRFPELPTTAQLLPLSSFTAATLPSVLRQTHRISDVALLSELSK